MTAITVEAPAKINLTLTVTGRRADGYHTLDTVMQTVSLCDTVTVALTDTGRTELTLINTPLQPDERNTAVLAAQAFFAATGVPFRGAAVTVHKRIPMQAGMGGGSADAAAVLTALDRLCGTALPQEALERIGLTVGADVPFCLRRGACRATGIGERLRPVLSLPDCAVLVMKPAGGVSTAEAYRAVDAYPYGDAAASDRMERALMQGNLTAVGGALANDFERALSLPETALLVQTACEYGAVGARLTGSGSAVYALFEQTEAAAACADRIRQSGCQTFVCHPVR